MLGRVRSDRRREGEEEDTQRSGIDFRRSTRLSCYWAAVGKRCRVSLATRTIVTQTLPHPPPPTLLLVAYPLCNLSFLLVLLFPIGPVVLLSGFRPFAPAPLRVVIGRRARLSTSFWREGGSSILVDKRCTRRNGTWRLVGGGRPCAIEVRLDQQARSSTSLTGIWSQSPARQ